MKITSQPLTFLDTTDSRKLEVYISSNHPTTQLYDVNDKSYTPDWSKTNLKLSADIFLDSTEIKPAKMKWYRQYINETTETLVSSGDYTEEITVNSNMSQAVITYICRVEYQGLSAFSKITFTRTDTGLNGKDGTDGTSVRILGTASAVISVSNTDYYTITYSSSAVTAAELGDAYLYDGNLYVCAVKRDTDDYFINVGNIQGPPGTNGTDAKLITLSSSSQVFKVNNAGIVTPTTITVTATAINTSVSTWTYSTDGGKTFTTTVPTGLSRNGNTITVTGATLGVNSVVIKATDGTHGDTLTVHKVADGADGAKGDPASMAFLTNENISFTANASGQVSVTAPTTNVVAYKGTEKVMPTVGTPSGMPSGMTIYVDSTSLASSSKEAILTISIADKSTLDSASSNHGTITIPITSPVSTNLLLRWSKINTGATGVGISSTTVTYGVSDSSSTQPTEWKPAIPEVEDGKYLWTRTVIDYTDPARADTVTYTYAKQGTIGETGNPGTSVTVSSVQYQSGTSATTAPNGTWSSAVVSVADGNYLWTKTTFSDGKIAYGVAKQGSAGTPASLVNITPSALYFKSTTGANGTFTPQYIYLYPRFQSATYSNWQYSRDGGATWTSAAGANGLTIGTYNSVANSLRVDRASTLYTNDITSISFKCNSTNASVYDTVSIAKLYDVVDLQIGGANLLRGTKDFIIDTNRINGWRNTSSYIITTDEDGFAVANKTSTTETTNVHYGIYSSVVRAAMGDKFTVSFWMKVKNVSLWDNQVPIILELYNDALGRVAWRDCQISYLNTTPSIIQNDVWTYCTLGFELNSSIFSFTTNSTWSDVKFFGIRFSLAKNGDVYFKKAKLEIGNKATDWSPAPEDLLDEAANVNVMLSNESHFFEATAGGVPTDASVVLDVVGYKGSIQSDTTVGVISGLPSAGMTATISSNNTTSTKITISVTSALTSSVADYGTLTIPITVNGHTINKKFNWVKAKAGDTGQPGGDAVTFQVYSNNGYALSINTPTITLQTFAYVGDIKIQSGATYQWYRYGNTDWIAISGATNSYFTVSRDDVAFSNSYMCKMQFNNAEYVGVATIDDKNDSNKVFTTKPSNYAVGDLWIVGIDYVPAGVEVGTLLKAEHTNTTYEDADWVTSLKYDDKIAELENDMKTYNQYFSFDSTDGLKISAKDNNGTPSQFSTSLTNERLSFNYGNEAIAYINGTKMNIKEAEIESPLTVTGKYSGSTMLQAPVINIGNFSIIVESNGSLSIVANT
jgi:hypothetical protein